MEVVNIINSLNVLNLLLDLSIVIELIKSHGKESATTLAIMVAALWRWWNVTKKQQRTSGANSELEETKIKDEHYEIISNRMKEMATDIVKLRRDIDRLEESLSRYRRFEREVQLNCDKCYKITSRILNS